MTIDDELVRYMIGATEFKSTVTLPDMKHEVNKTKTVANRFFERSRTLPI